MVGRDGIFFMWGLDLWGMDCQFLGSSMDGNIIMRDSGGSRRGGWTNNVLVERQKQRRNYYLPCYLRLKVKNIVDISLNAMQASFNADLIFTIYHKGLSEDLVTQLQDSIVMQFNRNDSILLASGEETTFYRQERDHLLHFTIRKTFLSKIDADLFWSPFELIKLVLVVTLRSLSIQQNGKIVTSIHFNLMNTPHKWTSISYTKEHSFGDYMITSKETEASYSNTLEDDPFPTNELHDQDLIQINTEGSQARSDSQECQHQKVKYFQYAHFYIGMYKLPFVTLSTVFLPMWSMGIYNIFMFLSNNDLSMRIGNGTLLNLALFAFIPTIRSQIPDTPRIILIEILIYIIGGTLTLNLIQSYYASLEDASTYAYEWSSDPYFLASFACILLTFLIIFVLYIIHKLHWQRQYLQEQDKVLCNFSRQKWRNLDCDEYFKKYPCIKPLK